MSVAELSTDELLELPEKKQIEIFGEINGSSSPEQVLQYGAWLSIRYGNDGHVVAPNSTVLKKAKTDYPELPSTDPVIKVLGSITKLPEALGFVTEGLAKTWTKEDYIKNGQWISHNLGDEQKPVMPRKKDLEWAARHKVGAPFEFIERTFGNVAAYQDALGFVTTATLERWTDQDWVDYGIWLSHLLGTPDEPQMPTSIDINEATLLGLCPPISAIEKKFKRSLPHYQDTVGFVTTATLERWTDQDWVDNGIWLGRLLIANGAENSMPSTEKIEEAADYNLVPKRTQIIARFGGIVQYQQALGFHNAQHYRTWSLRDYLRHGLNIAHGKSGRPSARDIESADGPSTHAIQTRFGTIAKFNERLGFTDYSHLSYDELINFGVRWAHEHNGQIVTRKSIDTLSKAKKGPGRSYVVGKFGDFESYRSKVKEDYEAFIQIREELLMTDNTPPAVIEFLLRDFQNTPEYEKEIARRVEEINELQKKYTIKFVELCKIFDKSRVTALWDEDDFLYFRSFLGKSLKKPKEGLEVLKLLDDHGLSPHLDEIEEVFGSLDDFIAYS